MTSELDKAGLEAAARAIAVARGVIPDALCRVDLSDHIDADHVGGDGRRSIYAWRRYTRQAEAAVRAYLAAAHGTPRDRGKMVKPKPGSPAGGYPAAPEQVVGKFKRGDRVRKVKGSSWHGIVVGEYSTSLTPIGYCVESDRESGSVQIYPEAALELVQTAPEPVRLADLDEVSAIIDQRMAAAPKPVAEAEGLEDGWVLIKRGLYWRPDAQGYTGLKSAAGRYSDAEASAYSAGGSGTTKQRWSLASELSPACSDEMARKHFEAKAAAADARITALQAEVERLRAEYREFVDGNEQLWAAQNGIVHQVWAILGGQDETRPGGCNLIGRVGELHARATTAEAEVEKLKKEVLRHLDQWADGLDSPRATTAESSLATARQQIERLREALKPFAFEGMEWRHGDAVHIHAALADIRRARAILKETENG
jgi:uncharacterized small protein (DUF1192 family)